MEATEARNRRLARSTLIVMIAFAIAKIISLGQVVIIAKVFGVGRDWDTYVSASQIPDQVYSLISGGALAYAFIPIFSGFLARKEPDRAWHVASRVINTVFLVTILISIIVFIFAPTAANIVAPGFDAAAKAQTAGL